MVFVTAILQDACLSIKVASNLAEREVTPTCLAPEISLFSFFFKRLCPWDRGMVSWDAQRQHMFVEMECFRSFFLIHNMYCPF